MSPDVGSLPSDKYHQSNNNDDKYTVYLRLGKVKYTIWNVTFWLHEQIVQIYNDVYILYIVTQCRVMIDSYCFYRRCLSRELRQVHIVNVYGLTIVVGTWWITRFVEMRLEFQPARKWILLSLLLIEWCFFFFFTFSFSIKRNSTSVKEDDKKEGK